MKNYRGFLEYERIDFKTIDENIRAKNNDEFFIPLENKEQEIQAARCMGCGIPFCQAAINIKGHEIGCPNLNLIPEWNDLLSRGLWDLALKRLELTMPFGEITGRICPAPCEIGCVNYANSDAVSIKNNEFAITEWGFKNNKIMPNKNIKRNGKKVAIIGSGPAGLACANELNKMGYSVSVFEKDDKAGGLLMYGIPDCKLSKEVVQRRVNLLKEEGIEFVLNYNVDSKEKVKDLKKNFHKIVLCVGSREQRSSGLKNMDLNGVCFAMEFLTNHTRALHDSSFKNPLNVKGKKVAIIGAGDTSNDCVSVSIRQGAAKVTRIQRAPKKPAKRSPNNPWPQMPDIAKTDYGIYEALAIYKNDPREYSKVIKSINGDKQLKSITTVGVNMSYVGNVKKSVEILNSDENLDIDFLIFALGFSGCENYIFDAFGIKSKNNLIEHHNFKTSVDNIYSCGDCNIGPSLVVNAIKEGRECAHAVHFDFSRNL